MGDGIRQAAALHRQGKLGEAAEAYEAILAADGGHFDALHLLGVVRLQQARPEEAVTLLERAIEIAPDMAEAHYHMAHAQRRLGRHEDAIRSYRRALAIRPDYAEALFNLANALRDLGRREEATLSYRRFIEIRPDLAEAHYHLANMLKDLGRGEEALAHYRRALELRPDVAEVHYNLGITLRDLGRLEEAVRSYQRALEIQPVFAEAHNNLGVALRELHQLDEALDCFGRALQIAPAFAEAHSNLGATLNDLKRHEEAVASHRRALELRPDMAETHYNLGVALAAQQRHEDATLALRSALELRPDYAEAHFALGRSLRDLGRLDEAIGSLQRALEIDPDHPYAYGTLAYVRRCLCDWSTAERDAGTLARQVREGRLQVRPFAFLAFSDDPADQLRCATIYVRDRLGRGPAPVVRRPDRGDRRIRLGYLSADLREHAVAWLVAGLFELHDRSQFEVLGFSMGPDDGSALRRRLERGFDTFHDIRGLGDRQAAELMAEAGVDIAIDLNGHTRLARPGILAHRPAPVQVAYLGYPGTMGADFIDYVLVDPFVAPAGQQPHFSEQLVHLPDCYQVNDRERLIDEATPTRAECGLPEHGFVFCCFNQNYKITPEVFSVWMRLLDAVPGSVLWLFRNHLPVEANLRREAAARGVDPERLVFASFARQAQHLARHRLADVFLDTLPYGAHTTASDALWAGLPVLTCAGRSFAARVAGSLLHAVGLPELITWSLEEYEALALALALARNPTRLAALRHRLARNRTTMPLFDTDRQRRNLERAYDEMWRRHESGQPPAPFAVATEGAV